MTSSLVGSEMCIRDRPYVAPSTVHACSPPAPISSAVALAGASARARRFLLSLIHIWTLPTICSV
eukprot:3565051-Prorocentrum_lima.AAC.1